ncbi:hypothetical protein [Fibrivirga algicola]|uniref:Uncharacterized protein n=1 Tax=Fibrivirga algicola TaxID=2950420 RepID=A0ABX0QAR8_9BACT|nr:hypothetical protein [Fibrivirga algicola]NID09369.1 hypothetical protein [Fibrivirga algicola]
MSKIQDVIADPLGLVPGPNRMPQPGVKRPKSNFLAVALVAAGVIPAFGTSWTPPGGTAGALTAGNLVSGIKALCYNGQATFLGDGQVNGKRGAFSEFQEAYNYGSRTKARPTGFGDTTYSFDNRDQYLNVEFFNQLRSAQTPYDIFVFTDFSVEVIRWADHTPVYGEIKNTVEGDVKKDIPGSFSIMITSEGEIPPVFGISKATLLNDLKFTMTAAVTGLVAVAGATNTYTLAATTLGVLTPTLGQALQAGGLKYSIFSNISDDVPTAQVTTVNAATGVVNIGTTLPTGTYRYTLVVENTTGVTGSFTFTVQKA